MGAGKAMSVEVMNEKKRKRSDDGVVKKKKTKKTNGVVKSAVVNSEVVDFELNEDVIAESTEARALGGENEKTVEVKTKKLSVSEFNLSATTVGALKAKGIESLFEIQAATLDVIQGGLDVIARAKTGSGKTLAFVLPVVEGLSRNGQKLTGRDRSGTPTVVVLAPTRELANQVNRDFEFVADAHGLKSVCIYGGAPFGPQCNAIRSGVDIVVATPGRLNDHLERGTISLSAVKYFVLDEADEMLSMGFKDEVEKILQAATAPHQTLLFSATVPRWVTELARKYLKAGYRTVDMVGEGANRTNKDITHFAISCPWQARGDTLGDLVKASLAQAMAE